MKLRIYNSLTRRIEDFTPLNPPKVGMYTCGQTVYDYTHIGHGRKYVNDDLLRRILTLFGFQVTHVQNITDVGHLVSDSDEGEDKLEKGAKKTGKTVWEVADFFTQHFFTSMDKLNVLRPTVSCRATDHIAEQIDLIQKILKRGLAYDTPEAVYFDTVKFKKYASLFGQRLEEKKKAVRQEVQSGRYKKNPTDFVLWFKRVGRFKNHQMHWLSPWGDGFPGWHIECSAMSMKYLGETFDIHTGGYDHLNLHHPNEIAQSEAATGRPFVKYWIHYAFLLVDGQKMSKSLGNYYRLEDLEAKGFEPMALRYLYLTVHYRQELNFTWASLQAAAQAYAKLKEQFLQLQEVSQREMLSQEKLGQIDRFRQLFYQALADDLNIPAALAVTWQMLKSNIPSLDKYDLLNFFNEIFGLRFNRVKEVKIPAEVQKLAKQRQLLRQQGDFAQADKIRDLIKQKGFLIEDEGKNYKIKPIAVFQKVK